MKLLVGSLHPDNFFSTSLDITSYWWSDIGCGLLKVPLHWIWFGTASYQIWTVPTLLTVCKDRSIPPGVDGLPMWLQTLCWSKIFRGLNCYYYYMFYDTFFEVMDSSCCFYLGAAQWAWIKWAAPCSTNKSINPSLRNSGLLSEGWKQQNGQPVYLSLQEIHIALWSKLAQSAEKHFTLQISFWMTAKVMAEKLTRVFHLVNLWFLDFLKEHRKCYPPSKKKKIKSFVLWQGKSIKCSASVLHWTAVIL